MTPTEKFWNYLKPIFEAQAGVVFADMSEAQQLEKWWAKSRAQDLYPGVFLIRPTIETRFNGTFVEGRSNPKALPSVSSRPSITTRCFQHPKNPFFTI